METCSGISTNGYTGEKGIIPVIIGDNRTMHPIPLSQETVKFDRDNAMQSTLLERIAHVRGVTTERLMSVGYRIEMKHGSFEREVPQSVINTDIEVDTTLYEKGLIKTIQRYGFRNAIDSFRRYFTAKDLMIHYYNWKYYETHGFWRTLQSGRILNAFYSFFEKNIFMRVLETNVAIDKGRIRVTHEETIDESWAELMKNQSDLKVHMIVEYQRMRRRGMLKKLDKCYSPLRIPKVEIATTLAAFSFVGEGMSSIILFKNLEIVNHPEIMPTVAGTIFVVLPILMGYVIEPGIKKLKRFISDLINNTSHQTYNRIPIPVQIQ